MTLRRLREQNEKTLREITEALNVSLQTVYRYEQGVRRINIEQVLILSKLYDCTAEEVIEAQLNSCQSVQANNRK
jgi:transcriptional regulator with XRE-family HTH domain